MKNISDLTLADIIERKAQGRRDLARLSFGEKVRIVEEMRGRLAPFNAMRAKRKAMKDATQPNVSWPGSSHG